MIQLYNEEEHTGSNQTDDEIYDMGSIMQTKGKHAIHCLTVIGQIEGHMVASQSQKTTKYEHVIPQLVAVQKDPAI